MHCFKCCPFAIGPVRTANRPLPSPCKTGIDMQACQSRIIHELRLTLSLWLPMNRQAYVHYMRIDTCNDTLQYMEQGLMWRLEMGFAPACHALHFGEPVKWY